MPHLFQDSHLLHDFGSAGFVREELLVDAFDCHHFFGESVDGQVDFVEGSAAKHFSDSVEVARAVWSFPCHLKGRFDELLKLHRCFRPRREIQRGDVSLERLASLAFRRN